MPNKNYEKGRNKEYAIAKDLKTKGYDIAQRTAGSHSPFDVIAIDISNRKILLVQSKPDNMTWKAKNKLCEANKLLNGVFNVRFVII